MLISRVSLRRWMSMLIKCGIRSHWNIWAIATTLAPSSHSVLNVVLSSPIGFEFKLGNPTIFASKKQPNRDSPFNYAGVIMVKWLPDNLLTEQQDQGPTPRWKLVVSDAGKSYEFDGVWFHAHSSPHGGFRINFGSIAGPASDTVTLKDGG